MSLFIFFLENVGLGILKLMGVLLSLLSDDVCNTTYGCRFQRLDWCCKYFMYGICVVRVFPSRKLRILGYSSQSVENWISA